MDQSIKICEKCNLSNEVENLRSIVEIFMLNGDTSHQHVQQTRIDNSRRIMYIKDIDSLVDKYGKDKVLDFLNGEINEQS